MEISSLGQQFVQGGLLDSISRFVGGDRDTTRKTLSAALPTTMYGIADRGSTEVGAAGLLDELKSGRAPQVDISELGSLLGDPQRSQQLVTSSGGFLERMLGPKLGTLLGALSSFGGGDRGVTSKILSLAAPLALGVVGKRVHEGGLDAGGLASFLGDQKSKVASMIPGPLRQTLGLPAAPDVEVPRAVEQRMPAAAEARVPRVVRPVSAPHRFSWPLALIIVLAALIGLGWLLANGVGRRAVRPTTTLPTVTAPPSSIADYLASGQTAPRSFALTGVGFGSGESSLSPRSQRGVSDLAATLKAHPNASVRLIGSGDIAGDRALGQARASAVKGALVTDGVPAERIATTTSGPEQQPGVGGSVQAVVTPR
jgi:OmpA-OmpF porin, OOP family